MSRQVTVLERIQRVAPLGFQLWDVATQTVAERDLDVTGRTDDRSLPTRALQASSGAYVLRGLTGLRTVETADATAAFWSSPPTVMSAVVEVTDPFGRYLPLSFTADLPHRGLFDAPCGFSGTSGWDAVELPADGSPPATPRPVVPIFSAPTRAAPAGLAVVRADLEIEGSGEPASWALIRVTVPGRPAAVGVADGRGRATVMFAYPEPPGLSLSPPGPPTVPLSRQQWTLDIDAYFGVASPPGIDPVAGPEEVPDLCRLLAQEEATLMADSSTPLQTAQLHYGRELHLKTSGRSTLSLVPSVSSP